MTRIFSEGFEFGDRGKFPLTTLSTIQSTVKRTGDYALMLLGTTNIHTYALPNLTEFYTRFCVYVENNNWSAHPISILATDATTELAYIQFINGRVEGHYGSLGSQGVTIRGHTDVYANTWYVIELYGKGVHTQPGTYWQTHYDLSLWVDGILQGSDTTIVSIFNADALFPIVANTLKLTGENTFRIYFDDIAINSVDGGPESGRCGFGGIELLQANGNGDASELDGSDGNSTDNYLLIDEVPPSSSDYVESSVIGEKDLYNVETFTTPSGHIVDRVWPETRSWKDAYDMDAGISLGIKPGGGSEAYGSTEYLPSSPGPIVGSGFIVNPLTGLAWTDSDLGSIQIAVKVM